MKHIFLSLICLCCALCAMGRHSGTLPVLYVNTADNVAVTSKENYVDATWYLDNCGVDGIESVGSAEDPQSVQIKGRGNYTWTGFNKKPYKLKFPKKIEFLGMDKNKHFALLAHADDNLGFLRNAVGFELSRRLGLAWTPSDVPIEFYLNGEYMGLYFATQTIRVDKTRVNITEQEDLAETDVTGGWLVEIDNYDSDPHVTVMETANIPIWFTYKSPEVLSAQQQQYLKAQLEAMNKAIYAKDKESDEWLDYFDIDSAAKYYIVQELMDDCESYHGSCYLYKDAGDDARWHFGPVWDFGNAMLRGDKSRFVWDRPPFHQTWIGELCKFPAFQTRVKEIWKEFCENGYEGLHDFIEEYAQHIEQGAVASNARWPEYGNTNVISKASAVSNNIRKSVAWLGKQWGTEVVEPITDPVVYLRGTFNNWSLTHPMTSLGNGRYEIYVGSLGLTGDFKLATSDWTEVDLGATERGMTPVVGQEFMLKKTGSNITAPRNIDSHYLILDVNVPSLMFSTTTSVDMTVENAETPVIYTLDGRRVPAIEEHGVYLLRYSDRVVKVVR